MFEQTEKLEEPYLIAEGLQQENKNSELQALFRLQQKLVQKKMHKAMSPISAISGYLELMKMMLEQNGTDIKIEQYRSKVEDGVRELNEIVEDLYELFDEKD